MTADQMKQLDENTKLTKDIHKAIVGDAVMGHTGLVERVNQVDAHVKTHDVRLDEHEKKFVRYSGILFGLLVAWEAYKALVLGLHHP